MENYLYLIGPSGILLLVFLSSVFNVNYERLCDCGSAFSIAHARIDFGEETTYKNMAHVICNAGYDIRGPSFITCLSDGTWSKTTSCHIKTCPSSYALSNGYVRFHGRTLTYQETVSVMCNTGYEIQGHSIITCLADGTWSKDTMCRIKDCGRNYFLDHGHVDFPGFETTYAKNAPITCDNGYTLQGDSVTTCLSDGKWSQFSRCIANDCGTVYPLESGYVDFAGRESTFGHAIPVKCDLGYALKGDTTITCQADGTWSKNTFCIIKSCKNDVIIKNGEIHFTGKETGFNTKVPITCKQGFEIQGDNFTTCLQDGSWTSNTICAIKDCGNTFSVMNGQVHYNMKDTTVNMTAQVSCVDGFEIKGDDFVICQPDGTWSNATCIESTGLTLPIVIGVPAAVVAIIFVVSIFILKRKRKLCFRGRW